MRIRGFRGARQLCRLMAVGLMIVCLAVADAAVAQTPWGAGPPFLISSVQYDALAPAVAYNPGQHHYGFTDRWRGRARRHGQHPRHVSSGIYDILGLRVRYDLVPGNEFDISTGSETPGERSSLKGFPSIAGGLPLALIVLQDRRWGQRDGKHCRAVARLPRAIAGDPAVSRAGGLPSSIFEDSPRLVRQQKGRAGASSPRGLSPASGYGAASTLSLT